MDIESKIEHFTVIFRRLRAASNEARLRILDEYFKDVNNDLNSDPQHPKEPIHSLEQSSDNTKAILDQVTSDERGRLCFYGATSFYYARVDQVNHGPSLCNDLDTYDQESHLIYDRTLLLPNQMLLEELRLSDSHLQTLLDTYWHFPHHLHLVLSRKLFMSKLHSWCRRSARVAEIQPSIGDLPVSGPYAPPFLLCCVLSQAARYSDIPAMAEYGKQCLSKALNLLPETVQRGASFPSIQGLLILSARECAYGHTSQGWLYSGMAFRMMRDLGLHIAGEQLARLQLHLSDDELHLRQQVFWSCYTWDKTISLCLGRPPEIQVELPVIQPEDIPDGEDAEREPWMLMTEGNRPSGIRPADEARSNSRFSAFCKLSIVWSPEPTTSAVLNEGLDGQ